MTGRTPLEQVFKAYDVRGVVGAELDVSLVRRIGRAAARVLGVDARPFVVGRDMRPTSPELAAAFVDGVTSEGLDVVDVGLASTDLLYFASGIYDAPGAMFTASHNPAEYNGIKFCGRRAAPVSQDTGLLAIRDTAARFARSSPAAARRGRVTTAALLDRFAEHVVSFADGADLRGLRVAVDAGNGMAGLTWPVIAEAAGIVTEARYFTLDGTFPNHPADPLDRENLRDLQAAVVSVSAAVGFAFDGDADRVFAVDNLGNALAASLTGAVIAERVLAREPGAHVLHNLICSRAVPEAIRGAGGIPVRTRVGHSFIKHEMARYDAALAIEHSGHFYFREHFRADSGAIAAIQLLAAMVHHDRGLATIVAEHDRYVQSGERNFAVADPKGAIARVTERFATTDCLDGLTVELADGWFNLRTSNTEPVLRLNAEARDPAALRRIVDDVAALVGDT